jgi:Rab proteins geranylgeranyltransferase component A
MGRALRRAQNDNNSTLTELTQHDDMVLSEYMKSLKMSDMLQDIIVHALCFHVYDYRTPSTSNAEKDGEVDSCNGNSSLSTARALDILYANINSIGRYGKTPFLLTLYGSGEIGQAFCRMAAVYGATFVLRRGVKSIQSIANGGSGDGGNGQGDADEEVEQAEKETETERRVYSIVDTRGIARTCSHLLLNAAYCPHPYYTPYLRLTRISILDGYILPARKGSVAVLPPGSGSVGNSASIYVIEVDDDCSISCERGVVLHCSTVVKRIREDEGDGLREYTNMMNMAMQLLLATANDGNDDGRKVTELCYSTSVRPSYDTVAMQSHYSNETHLHIVSEGEYSLHNNNAFNEARRVFTAMYPSEEFMPRTEQDEAHDNHEEEEADLEELYAQAMAKESENDDDGGNGEANEE